MHMKALFLPVSVAALLLAGGVWGSWPGLRAWVGTAAAVARGNAAYGAGAYGDAEVWFRKALNTSTALNAGQYNLGNALCQQGRYAEAAQCYRQALPTCPPRLQAQAWANLGQACYQAGQLPASYAAYRHALLLRPADEATRQDFLFVRARLAARPPAGPPPRNQPAPPSPAPPDASAASPGSQGQPPQSSAPPASQPPQQLSEKDMQAVFSTITEQENRLRSNLSGSRQQVKKTASDGKDY